MVCRKYLVHLGLLLVVIALNIGEITAYTHAKGRILLDDGKDLTNTVRSDPLDNLKKYRGGFDITNKHYWSSTAYTGIYGYAIGALWLLCGVLFGGYLLMSSLCCTKKSKSLKRRQPCSRQCYLWPIMFGTSFTILAIIASGIVIGGTTRFHSRAKTVMDIIIDTTDGASNTIYNATDAMRDISNNIALSSGEGVEASNFLDTTSDRLDSDAAKLSRQARKNRNLIDKGLKIVYITTTTVISLNLIAVIVLSICGFLKFRRAFYMLIVLCWLMTMLCWVFFGLYFFLDNFASDTCTALEDFQQDPHNNSLSSIVPCNELISAKSVLLDTRVGIFNLINEVNRNISTFQASLGVNLFQICNPFSAPPEYNYQPGNCSSNTIRIGDIPQILKVFTCSNGEVGACAEGQFISANDYKTVEAYTSSVQNLLNTFPGMENLVDCQTVKDAFATILSKHCKPVNKYVTMVWASLIVLSSIMVVVVIVWTMKVFYDERRHFSDGSVKPHLAATSTYEVEEKMERKP